MNTSKVYVAYLLLLSVASGALAQSRPRPSYVHVDFVCGSRPVGEFGLNLLSITGEKLPLYPFTAKTNITAVNGIWYKHHFDILGGIAIRGVLNYNHASTFEDVDDKIYKISVEQKGFEAACGFEMATSVLSTFRPSLAMDVVFSHNSMEGEFATLDGPPFLNGPFQASTNRIGIAPAFGIRWRLVKRFSLSI